ncbi:MAG: ABC transporter substrate-binding protein [Rhodocyclaceae bacterium]
MNRRCILKSAAALSLVLAAPLVWSQETTLRFSWWGGAERHEATLKAIAAFEAKHPGVKVKGEYMGFNGYQERLSTQIAGGNEPDIMQINWAWMSAYSKRGDGFVDLNKYKNVMALKEFSAEELRMGTIAGKLNGLPVTYSARIFQWNKAALDKAGVAVPATWDDLFSAGKAFRAKLGDRAYLLDGELNDMIVLAQTYVEQKYGTQYLHPTQPKVAMSDEGLLEWVRFYKRLADERVAIPLPVRDSLGGASKPTEQQPDWSAGYWGGSYIWDSVIRLREGSLGKDPKYEIGKMPLLQGSKTSGLFGRPGMMFVVGKNSKQPELAAKFIDFMLADPEAARTLGLTRGMPAADSQYKVLTEGGLVTANEIKAFELIQKYKDSGQITLPSPLYEHPRMQRLIREVFEQVGYGKINDQQAAKRLREEGEALLRRL